MQQAKTNTVAVMIPENMLYQPRPPPDAIVIMTLSCFSCDPPNNLTSCCGLGDVPPTPRCTSQDWTEARAVAPTSLQIMRRSLMEMTPVSARCLGWRSGSRCITSAKRAPFWDMARRGLHWEYRETTSARCSR